MSWLDRAAGAAMILPEGTVTFFRSDIEGSMDLSRALGARYDELNAEHQALVRAAIEDHGGQVVRTEGDSVFAVFTTAEAAARTAVDVQRSMAGQDWPSGHELRLRIGIHTGTAARAGGGADYGGFEVNRAARISASGWGGQIVVSDTARALIEDVPDAEWRIRDLGRHQLKGVPQPERLFQLEAPGLATEFAPLRSGHGPTEHLPEHTGSFIGREEELDALGGLLAATRLLTLTGPGGTGKTTLAVELARRHADAYADGAWFADLQAVRDAATVRAEIARAVGLHDGPTGPAEDRLADYVSERQLLLVVDNFEQVLEAADVVANLLAASRDSRIVVTSRVPLKLRAEQEYAVRPLRTDGDGVDAEAIRLFVDRARRARPSLILDVPERETVSEICRRVDGLPLAIELCAARAASLPLAVIRDRLRAHQPLPGVGPRDLPERQRTIEQTVAWSYDLLEPPLRRLYERLAVFEESFDVEQAAQVAGTTEELDIDVLDGLMALHEHSLLVRVDDVIGGLRFGWLETIRDHARSRLETRGEVEVMRDRHARAFAALSAAAVPHLPSARQGWWLDRLAADDANLRAALLHAIESVDVESALRLVAGLWRYWLQIGRLADGRALAERAMALPGAEAPTPLRVRALDAVGGMTYWSGDVEAANAIYEKELALAQDIGDRPGEALAWLDLFFTREFLGRIEDAVQARGSSARIYRELGDDFGTTRLEHSGFLILLARGHEDPGDVLPELEARAAEAEALEDPWLARGAWALRAYASFVRGDLGEATTRLLVGIRANLAVREWADAALGMQFAVVSLSMSGQAELATVVHGSTQAVLERLGIRPPASYTELAGFDPIPPLRESLGPETFDAAVERGRRLSTEEAVALIERAMDVDDGSSASLSPHAGS